MYNYNKIPTNNLKLLIAKIFIYMFYTYGMNIFRTLYKTHSYNSYKEAERFAREIPEETWDKMSKLLFKDNSAVNPYDMRISGLSRDYFQDGQLFYHGEQANKRVKNYMLDKFYIICEEMGDGLYISPSKNIAAFWAGIRGKIFKLKLNTDKIAEVNQNQIEYMVNVIARNVKGFTSNPTGQRLNVIIRMLFQKNGYDAAYSRKTMSNSFEDANEFFDTVIGEHQQQLAIYNNDVIEVLPKNLKEKFVNQILQIKSYIQYYVNLAKYYKNEK